MFSYTVGCTSSACVTKRGATPVLKVYKIIFTASIHTGIPEELVYRSALVPKGRELVDGERAVVVRGNDMVARGKRYGCQGRNMVDRGRFIPDRGEGHGGERHYCHGVGTWG